MKNLLIKAVKGLKNNYESRYICINCVPKTKMQQYKEFMIGIYNRFDEIGLIYSELQNISFNKAIEELELQEYMNELKIIIYGDEKEWPKMK